jgi:hypothetical protein
MTDEPMTNAAPDRVDSLLSMRYVLAGLCGAVFIAVLLLLARMVRIEPLRPLRDVGITALWVCITFAVCLASVAIFSRRRSEAERRREVQR